MKDLRKWRERKGLSQKEVAISLGVAPPQISKWESGTTDPTLENLIKLSELYGITLDEIIGRPQLDGTLTHEERDMVRIMRRMNQEGRKAVMNYAEFTLSKDEFRKELLAETAT